MVLIFFMLGLMISCLFSDWYFISFLMMIVGFFCLCYGYSEYDFWGYNFIFGMDCLGWSLMCLSIWVGILMLLASYYSVNNINKVKFVLTVIFLIFFLCLTFMVYDYMFFYIFFEASLIPIFALIMGWGYQPERLQAGIYLLFYTLFGSLPLLLSFIYLWDLIKSLNYYFCYLNFHSLILFIGVTFGFLIKMPMFIVHLWLPKAHVEAPISGSMMLAGVLLKLGGYGLMRILCMFKFVMIKYGLFFISLSMFSFSLVSLICMRQYDLKSLIAYSSVAHMSLIIAGLMISNIWGYFGTLVMMLGHGLCSSGLFCLANIIYERLGSRSLMINSGMMLLFPGLCLWWFLLSICNMAAPPSLNLLGEVGLMISIFSWANILGIFIFFGSLLSGSYTIYMYSLTQHGKCLITNSLLDCKIREYLLLLLHWLPLNLIILKSEIMM